MALPIVFAYRISVAVIFVIPSGLTAETLAGIPSILYGLFGMMFFVTSLRWSYSLLAGGMTLAVMILPLILRTTEEALLSVPDSYREGSFGLGAGRLRTVTRIVLPPAMSGILAGVILAIGRVVGETAALIYTAGTVADWPKGVMSSGRTLAVHMYVLSGEGLHVPEASATAVVPHDPRLLEKLRRLAEKYPDQIVKKDRQTFLVPKRCVSVREPYSAERRKAASELAKAAGYRPPTPKKGNE